MSVAGLNAQAAPGGNPRQLSATELANPSNDVTVHDRFVLPPAGTARVEGAQSSVKFDFRSRMTAISRSFGLTAYTVFVAVSVAIPAVPSILSVVRRALLGIAKTDTPETLLPT